MDLSLVSIVIPVFNRQDLIKETLDSVLAQTYQNWECIVVDDDSEDDTWLVLEEYARIDKRIKIHKREREPKGAPTSRNIGVELSNGEYLMFWDSDDILAPWCVKERVFFMDNNPNLDFGLFQLLNVSTSNEYSLRCHIGEDDYLKRFLSFKNAWGTHAVIWQKKFFKCTGGWNEKAKIWQDGEIHIRALLKNPNYEWGSIIPDGIIRFGIDDNSISTKNEPIVSLLNRLIVISDVISLLEPSCKHILSKGVRARIWSKTYTSPWKDKLKVINNAYQNRILSKKHLNKYKVTYFIYFFFKKIPIFKGGYYRLFIEPNFKNFEFMKTTKLSCDIKRELLKKSKYLDIKDNFRKRIEIVLRANINLN